MYNIIGAKMSAEQYSRWEKNSKGQQLEKLSILP